MSNNDKLVNVFVSSLGMQPGEVESAEFKENQKWDSVGHVNLMNAVEEAFDVSLEPDDILDFKSFTVGKTILERYGVEF